MDEWEELLQHMEAVAKDAAEYLERMDEKNGTESM